MEQYNDQRQLRIGFIDRPDSDQQGVPTSVPVQEFAGVLVAVQRTLFATAAYQLGLPGSRNLTDEQRQRFTLVIVGSETGSLWELAKFLVESAASGVVGGMAWDTLKMMIGAFRQVSQGDSIDPRYAQVVLPQLIALIEAANRSGKFVDTTYRDATGLDFSYRTSPEGDIRVMETWERIRADQTPQAAEEVRPFENGRVLDIVTTDHSLVVKFPYFSEPVVCIYVAALEDTIVRNVRVYDEVTIFGRIKPLPKGTSNRAGFYIDVEAMQTAQGELLFDREPPAWRF